MSPGFAVEGTFDEVDDPVLIGPDGVPVETWREGYPYDTRVTRDEYEQTKRLLQIELLKRRVGSRSPTSGSSSSSRGRERGRQGRKDQAVHGASQSPRGQRRRHQLDYPDKDTAVLGEPDPLLVGPPEVVATEAGEYRTIR